MTIEMWSADRRYGLRLEHEILDRFVEECAASDVFETGGMLVGRYSSNRDCAVVIEVVPPPSDSRRGRTWFERGVRGLSQLLTERWRTKRQVYLGEWHFHPGEDAACASPTDREQIRILARDAAVRCPVPILLVAGGVSDHLRFRAWVAPHGAAAIELLAD